MKGYFSRLIKQTGIAFEPHRNSRTSTTGITWAGFREYESGALDRAEGTGMTEIRSRSLQNEKPIVQDVQTTPAPVIAASVSGDQQRARTNVLPKAQKQEYPLGQDVPRDDTMQPEINSTSFEIRETSKNNNDGNRQSQELRSMRRMANPQTDKKSIIGKKNTIYENNKPDNDFSLKDIRNWVIGGVETMDVEKKVITEKSRQDEKNKGDILEKRLDEPSSWMRNSGVAFSHLQKKISRQEADEGRDFNLSIGTISVTLEDQKKQIMPLERPKVIEVGSRSGNDHGSARLGRHYIR